MRVLAPALFLLLGPATLVANGRSELDILRARCTEQERQIRTLETEIESLHSQLALERRRSRGVVPSAAPASPVPPAPAPTYTVTSGDTLSSIARRYRTSVDILMKRNGIEDPTRLRVGQSLTLPENAHQPKSAPASPAPKKAESVVSAPTTKSKPAPKGDRRYKVQRGDTLYGIARKHKMSISDLRSLNPKVEQKIMVGQNLVVNGKPQVSAPPLRSSTTHTISTRATPPDPKPAAKKAPEKKPVPTKKTVDTKPKPASKPVVVAEAEAEESPKPAPKPEPAPAPATISSIIVMDEISFGDFAKKHGTTPSQLNDLNGWDFKGDLVLARGSEIYVPGR